MSDPISRKIIHHRSISQLIHNLGKTKFKNLGKFILKMFKSDFYDDLTVVILK